MNAQDEDYLNLPLRLREAYPLPERIQAVQTISPTMIEIKMSNGVICTWVKRSYWWMVQIGKKAGAR